LSPWAFQPDPRPQAENIARAVGITSWTSTADLVARLRNTPFQTLIDAQRGWIALDVPRGFYAFDWAPVVEPPNSPETRFLTDNPVNLMRSGNFLRMPFSKFKFNSH
jgi:hypothetical protein